MRTERKSRTMKICEQCGLNHARLAVTFRRGTLRRKVDQQQHMVRANGGAWAFETALLVRHPEIQRVVITDRNTGETWSADRATFEDHAFAFHAAGREQIALALQHWKHKGKSTLNGATNVNALDPHDAVQGTLFGVESTRHHWF